MSNDQTESRLRRMRLSNRLFPAPRRDIRFDKRLFIREIQQYLRAIEPDAEVPLIPDGVFDAATAEAVRRFQLRHGLTPDGRVDYPTWKAIVAEARRLS